MAKPTSAAEIIFFPVLQSLSDPFFLLTTALPTLQNQQGFKAAHFGPLHEDPKIWCFVIEWTSKDDLIAWTRNYNAEQVKEMSMKMIDMEAGLEPFATFVNFAHDPTNALVAPVTEFGFFSLPDKIAKEDVVFEKLIGPGEDMSSHPVMTVGKALGGACGAVFAVKPEMAREGQTTCFMGVFGYANVEDHIRWRDTSEHANVIKQMEPLKKDLGLAAVDVLGKRRAFVEGTGIVHAKLKKLG